MIFPTESKVTLVFQLHGGGYAGSALRGRHEVLQHRRAQHAPEAEGVGDPVGGGRDMRLHFHFSQVKAHFMELLKW